MLTRPTRLRVGAFIVIGLIGLSYVGARYAGLDRLLGPSGYVVRVQLSDSGGLFTNSEVTYRGVPVGRVGPMKLVRGGLEAELDIDTSAPPIPADSDAVVANRSAVGEQYIDLRPRRDGGPFLAGGAVIAQQRTSTPRPVETLLTNLDNFVSSVPTDSLRTVVDELGTAFTGTGPDLQVLLDATSSFTEKARQHLPQTTNLINDGATVLKTQAELSDALKALSTNAKLLTEQFRNSDPDLRRLIAAAPPVAEQVSALIRESGPNLGVVMANLLTTADILVARRGGIEQLLVKVPQAVAAGTTMVRADGLHLGLAATFFAPLPCTAGYEGTRYRNGLDTSPGQPLNTDAGCTLPLDSRTGVRGSQHAPSGPAVPSAPTPDQRLGMAGLVDLITKTSDPKGSASPDLGALLGLAGR